MRPNKKPNVKISFSFPYDKPDANGNIYTKEAVYKAVQNIKDLPIIFNDFRNKDCSNPKNIIIGFTRKFKVEKEMDLCSECAKLIGTIIKTTPSEDTLDFDKTVTTLKALKSIKKT